MLRWPLTVPRGFFCAP